MKNSAPIGPLSSHEHTPIGHKTAAPESVQIMIAPVSDHDVSIFACICVLIAHRILPLLSKRTLSVRSLFFFFLFRTPSAAKKLKRIVPLPRFSLPKGATSWAGRELAEGILVLRHDVAPPSNVRHQNVLICATIEHICPLADIRLVAQACCCCCCVRR